MWDYYINFGAKATNKTVVGPCGIIMLIMEYMSCTVTDVIEMEQWWDYEAEKHLTKYCYKMAAISQIKHPLQQTVHSAHT